MKGLKMEIKIQFKDYVLSFCFGRKTDWFEQEFFFSITKKYYCNREVIWADLVFHI